MIGTIITNIAALPTAATIKTAIEVDGSKLDHLWEMTEDDAGTRRLTTNSLEQAPSGGLDAAEIRAAVGLASANLDTQFAALPNDADVNLQCDLAISDAGIPAALSVAHGAGSWATAVGFSSHSAADVWAVATRSLTTFGSLVSDIAIAVWGAAIRILTAGTNIVLAKGVGITGFNDLSSADVAAAVSGAGAITWAYTLTDSTTGVPLDGAEVWVTTDSAGLNVIASGTTDTNGVVTFYLDAGTVYVWRKKAGYNFTNPDQETVS